MPRRPSEPVPEEDPTPLLDELALGWIEYRSLWQRILTPDNLAWIETLAALPADRFYLPGIGKHNDKFILILDIDKVFSTEELETLSDLEGAAAQQQHLVEEAAQATA